MVPLRCDRFAQADIQIDQPRPGNQPSRVDALIGTEVSGAGADGNNNARRAMCRSVILVKTGLAGQ